MKMIYLIAVIALCTNTADAQISVGGQIGVNFGMGRSGKGSIAPTNSPKLGLTLGVLADLPIVEKISFRPEFNFVQKGSTLNSTIGSLGGGSFTKKYSLSYLEVPLNVVYKMSLKESENKLYFGLGAAFAVGISGKWKDPSGKHKVKFDGKDNTSGLDEHLKRGDIGLNFLAGYQLKSGFFGKVGYTLGLPNLDPNLNETYKNRGISICVGYMVRGKKK